MPAKILVVGDSMVDRALHGTVNRLAQEAPVPVLAVDYDCTYAGGAANVAENLLSLGVDKQNFRLLTAAPFGSPLMDLVRSPVTWVRTVHDTVKTRLWAGPHMLARYDSDCTLLFEESDAFTDEYFAHMPKYDFIVFADYGRGALRQVDEMIHAARAAGKYVIVDPKGDDWHKYEGAHIIKANDKEARAASDFYGCDEEDLCAATGLEDLVVTRGARPTVVLNAVAKQQVLPVRRITCVDPVGAGDSFLAGMVTHLARAPLPDLAAVYAAVEYGNLCGAAAAARAGTYQVTQKDVEDAQRLPISA